MLAQCNGTYQVALPTVRKRVSERSTTFRTLCVRSCDGYYFPISFSTTRKYFEADEASCQRMCPAGDASLFYHRLRSEGPDQMVSIEGSPYASLENAFRYRTVLDSSCTCGTPLPYEEEENAAVELVRQTTPLSLAGDDLGTLLKGFAEPAPPRTVTAVALAVQAPAPGIVRVIMPPWTGEQDHVLLSDVPNARFSPEPEYFVRRGPGQVACFRRTPSCLTD